VRLTSFSQDKFANLKITHKFQQIGILDVDYFRLTPSEASKIVEGAPTRWFINGRLVFTGFIKRVDKSDEKEIWHVTAESAVSKLRDTITNINQPFYNTQYTDIINQLLPSGWTWSSTCKYPYKKISYHVTPGSVLQHIVNIIRIMGEEWSVSQDWHMNGDVVVYDGYRLSIASHIGSTTSTKTYSNFSSATTDIPRIIQNVVNLTCKKNEEKISTHVQAVGVSPEAANLSSNIAFNSRYFFPIANGDNNSETALASSMNNSTTWCYVLNPLAIQPSTTSYFSIDDETMMATSYATQFSGWLVKRGQKGSASTTHASGTDVLTLDSFTIDPSAFYAYIPATKSPINPATWATTTTLPATYKTSYLYTDSATLLSYLPANSGDVFIGEELIHYSQRTANVIMDLQRGCGYMLSATEMITTKKYSHKSGTFIRKYVPLGSRTEKYDVYAEAYTPASVYGFRKTTVDAMGVMDQDGVDKKAQETLISLANPYNYGQFTYLDSDMWRPFTLGDTITISKRAALNAFDKETFLSRIVGIYYDQYKPVVIEYGDVDELIMGDFSKADKAYDIAVNNNDNSVKTTVLDIDPNNPNVIKVMADGVEKWIEVV
jgi:hypothetical protein